MLGLSLAHSPEVSLAFIFAVAISNVPQVWAAHRRDAGGRLERSRITRLWLAVCVLSVAAAALGYAIGGAGPGPRPR